MNDQEVPVVESIDEVVIECTNPRLIRRFRTSTSGSGEIKSAEVTTFDEQQIKIGDWTGPVYDKIGTPFLLSDGRIVYPAKKDGKKILNDGGVESRAIEGTIRIIGEFENQALSIFREDDGAFGHQKFYMLGTTEGKKHESTINHKFFKRIGSELLYTAGTGHGLEGIFNFPDGKQFGPSFSRIEDVQFVDDKVIFIGEDGSYFKRKLVHGEEVSDTYGDIWSIKQDENKKSVYKIGNDIVFKGKKENNNWALVINFKEVLEEYSMVNIGKDDTLLMKASTRDNRGYMWYNGEKGPEYKKLLTAPSEIEILDDKPLYMVSLGWGRNRVIHGNQVIKGFESTTQYKESLNKP